MRAKHDPRLPAGVGRPRFRSALALLLALPATATVAWAAPAAAAPLGPGLPLRRLDPGQTLRFQIDAGQTLEARFHMVRGDSAYFIGTDGRPTAVPLDRMTRLWKRGGAAGAGALAAVGWGLVGALAFGAGTAMVPGGAALGAATGALFPRWRKLYDAAPAAAAPGDPQQRPFAGAAAFAAAPPPPGLSGWIHGATEVGFQPHSFYHGQGWGGSVGVLWSATPQMAVGAEVGYTEVSQDSEPSPGDYWEASLYKEGSILRSALVARIRPWQGTVRPYLLAGLEFCREDQRYEEPTGYDPYGNPVAWQTVEDTDTYYGVQGGPGVQIGSPRLSFGLQARGHLLAGEADTEGFFTFSAGLEWK